MAAKKLDLIRDQIISVNDQRSMGRREPLQIIARLQARRDRLWLPRAERLQHLHHSPAMRSKQLQLLTRFRQVHRYGKSLGSRKLANILHEPRAGRVGSVRAQAGPESA